MNNLLKNKIKSDYENLTENTSAVLWEKINERLEIDKAEKKTVALPVLWKYAAAVLILVSLGFTLKFINLTSTDQSTDKKAMVSSQKKEDSKEKMSFIIHQNTVQKMKIAKTEKVVINQEQTTQHLAQQPKTMAPKELAKNEPLFVSPKQEQTEKAAPNLVTYVSKDPMVSQTTPVEKTKYVTASELLFEREANKTLQNQNETMVTAELFQKPKQIKILGFTVYTDTQQ